MINADMRNYNYFTIKSPDSYGQPQLPAKDATPEGTLKMAIYTSSQAIQDNINYKDCNYIGFTHAKNLTDKYIIEFDGARLKVQYVNPKGRYKQVFLKQL